MASPEPDAAGGHPRLLRRLGLLQASALNMANMVGAGPFITIPILLSTLGGPQAMLGWVVALAITLCDGMVWSELAAAMPGSGGSYVYLREAFGRESFGRLMAFLFIWQFILSGPLEIASAYIGLANYTGYVWEAHHVYHLLLAGGVGLLTIVLLYRRITTIGWLAVGLCAGTILTCSTVIVTGLVHFDAATAFDFPPGAMGFSMGFLLGLGAATRYGVYDYFGYYDICYIGDEVKDPGKVMPRSIFISLVVIGAAYLTMNLGIISVVPWREFVEDKSRTAGGGQTFLSVSSVDQPAGSAPHDPKAEAAKKERERKADYVVSIFMERIYGPTVAKLFTLLILWTIVASAFAMLLGYSRIPYAAAKDGYFFSAFARLHPTKNFPHVSLLVIGLLSVACCAIPLGDVLDVLVAMRVLVQFMGQAVAVILLRRRAPQMVRPYRVWLYPLPNLIALLGWLFIFVTNPGPVILIALGMLAAGVCFFLVWSRLTHRWPFAGGG
jgi:amino acid transporter